MNLKLVFHLTDPDNPLHTRWVVQLVDEHTETYGDRDDAILCEETHDSLVEAAFAGRAMITELANE